MVWIFFVEFGMFIDGFTAQIYNLTEQVQAYFPNNYKTFFCRQTKIS